MKSVCQHSLLPYHFDYLLAGKTIKNVIPEPKQPNEDDSLIIEFTDGTIWKIMSAATQNVVSLIHTISEANKS